jgi:hypothetical protein
MTTNFKLEQLRARTDRELIALIDRELARALETARAASRRWANAEKVGDEARHLLPKVYNLGERLRLESKLKELREALDGCPDSERPRLRAAAG